VGDIVSLGPDQPRRPLPGWLIVVGGIVLSAAALAVIAVLVFGDQRGPRLVTPTVASPTVPLATAAGQPCLPVGAAQNPPVAERMAGLLIDRVADGPGSGLDRCDRTAVDGPWTAVVRRPDGSLGRHGAVVTFPVGAPTAGRSVGIDGVPGKAESGMVIWPVAGGYARIRGDLGEADLIAIAARTTVIIGRPTVNPPAGYTVVATGPYRPPTIHELRYGSAAVGEQAALGDGLTYTGVTSGGGFEDQLYAVSTDNGGLVNDTPAVVSPVFGGNATLAWEPAPGVVAYIGYSGSLLDGKAIAALQRLAGRARVLTSTEWQATQPQTIDQINEPG
jgi:hypothetical protein